MVKKFFVLMIIISFAISIPMNCFANEISLSTNEMTLAEKEKFLSNSPITLLVEEPEKQPISCFDVSQSELLAVGYENSNPDSRQICVFDSNGVFLYGYEFSTLGSYDIEWQGENLSILFNRSGVLIVIDEQSNVVDIKKFEYDSKNSAYIQKNMRSNVKSVNGIEYKLKNDFGIFNLFFLSYSLIVKTDEQGAEKILYDASKDYFLQKAVATVGIAVFISVSLMLTIKKVQKRKQGRKRQISKAGAKTGDGFVS